MLWQSLFVCPPCLCLRAKEQGRPCYIQEQAKALEKTSTGGHVMLQGRKAALQPAVVATHFILLKLPCCARSRAKQHCSMPGRLLIACCRQAQDRSNALRWLQGWPTPSWAGCWWAWEAVLWSALSSPSHLRTQGK